MVITPPETLRIRLLPVSAMYKLPAESKAMANGLDNCALVAEPLSPPKLPGYPAGPLPATVVTTPPETLRMRLLPVSAMYTLPAESTAMPDGKNNWMLVAGPLSPLNPRVPFPAKVVIIPPENFRTRLF